MMADVQIHIVKWKIPGDSLNTSLLSVPNHIAKFNIILRSVPIHIVKWNIMMTSVANHIVKCNIMMADVPIVTADVAFPIVKCMIPERSLNSYCEMQDSATTAVLYCKTQARHTLRIVEFLLWFDTFRSNRNHWIHNVKCSIPKPAETSSNLSWQIIEIFAFILWNARFCDNEIIDFIL